MECLFIPFYDILIPIMKYKRSQTYILVNTLKCAKFNKIWLKSQDYS